MASGQQKAQQNLAAFLAWQATQTNDDFKQITFKGQLNRMEIAKAVGCGKSAQLQNPALRNALQSLENPSASGNKLCVNAKRCPHFILRSAVARCACS